MATLLITKNSDDTFSFVLDGDFSTTIRNTRNDLTSVGNEAHFKTANGANLVKNQQISPSEVTIVDGGNTYNPTNITQLFTILKNIGYFDWINGGGGSGGVDRFNELEDTFQYFGKDGQVVVVNESQERLETREFTNVDSFVELIDAPDAYIPGKYLRVNALGTALVFTDLPLPPTDASKLDSGGYNGTGQDLADAIDNVGNSIIGFEVLTNKQDSLTTDGTGTKYPTVDAVNEGLSNIVVPDATTATKGIVKLAGDLGGTADLPTVPELPLKMDKDGYSGTGATLKAEIDAIYQPNVLVSSVPPTRSVNTFTYPANGYTALINKTLRTNPSAFVTTISAATTDYKRVDLIYFKSDNTIAKIVGTESLTVAARPDVPSDGVAISFINVFGTIIEDPTPVNNEISIQNSFGVEQFKVSDYMRFRGASFTPSSKQIVIDPLVPYTAFVDNVNGNNTTAEFGNVNKPYLSIDAVFSGMSDSVDRLIIVQLIRRGNYPINNRIPVGQTTIRSTLDVTLDLSANTNQYLFTYNSGTLTGATFTFDIPFGKIQNNRTSSGSGTSIAQAQTSFLVNVKEIAWDCNSFIFYGLTNGSVFQKLDILSTVGKIGPGGNYFTSVMVPNLTIPSNAVAGIFEGIPTVTINNLVLNTNTAQFDKNTSFRIGNITGTGRMTFSAQTGTTSVEFLNSTITPSIFINQGLSNLTFTGRIISCAFDTSTANIANGTLNFKNLIIENLTSGYLTVFASSLFTLNMTNATIKLPGKLLVKGNYNGNGTPITINVINSVIDQVTPAALIESTATSIVSLKIGSLETNATSLGNLPSIVVDYSLLSFKDKKNEIVVRSKVDLINKILDPNMTYLVDGTLTLLTGEYIQVPAGGLTINGYGFNPSSIKKNVAGQSIFISAAGNSGDFVSINISYYPGLGSVFNIKDIDGTHAIELDKVNFQGVTGSSLGILDGYRQFTGTTCGVYYLSDGLTLEGNWSGFKLTNSNVIGFGSTGTLFKKGTATVFSNRFYIDLNLQIATGSKISDFSDANFTNDKSLQVVNCYSKVNGVVDDATTSATFPNITPYSSKSYFVNNIGIKNSNNMPYGISTTNMQTYANDVAAAAGGIVQIGETYIESSTGYFKKRLT